MVLYLFIFSYRYEQILKRYLGVFVFCFFILPFACSGLIFFSLWLFFRHRRLGKTKFTSMRLWSPSFLYLLSCFHSNAWTIFTNLIAGTHTEGKKERK
ncbi:hypothetical protein I3843_09G183100 [Carya illinoinensis]|nr:hypothetical protein I3843_09G183100 [Carya illinoinensis]